MIKTILLFHIIAFVLGFFLDLLIGDPHWIYHPVRLIGLLVSLCEKIFLGKKSEAESDSTGEETSGKTDDKKAENTKIFFGLLTVITVLFITLLITGALCFWS